MTEVSKEAADFAEAFWKEWGPFRMGTTPALAIYYDSMTAHTRQELATTRAELAKRDAMIIQLGENAAKAAGEYAERVTNFASVLANAYQVLTYVEAVEGDADTKAACAEVRAEIDALDIKTAIRAALTEPTDG